MSWDFYDACHGTAIALPSHYHSVAMKLPYTGLHGSDIILQLTLRQCHGSAMNGHSNSTAMKGHGNGAAMEAQGSVMALPWEYQILVVCIVGKGCCYAEGGIMLCRTDRPRV